MSAPRRDWTLARHRLRDDVLGVLLVWAGFAVVVLAPTVTVRALRPIGSGWEMGSQLARWFAGGLGVYATAVYLPLYIAHGYTRREAARQLPLATLAAIMLLAGLMTVGYGIERLIYGAAGWSQTLSQAHLFPDADRFGLILVEFSLQFGAWAAAGALAGAAFYRSRFLGVLVAPAAIVLTGTAEAALSPGFFELVATVLGVFGLEPSGTATSRAVAAAAGCVVAALLGTWLLARDLPLRSKQT